MSEPDRSGWLIIAIALVLPVLTGIGTAWAAREASEDRHRREMEEISTELRGIRRNVDEINERMQDMETRLDRVEADVRTLRRDVDELQEIAVGS